MAAHHLTIAKASFAASLMRPDGTKVTRNDLSEFHTLFEAAIAKPSPHNIQNCKQWLLDHALASAGRTNAFAKYLTSYSKYPPAPDGRQASTSRQRLHILYLLNDLLHHGKYHSSEDEIYSNLIQSLYSSLPDLFQLAASEKTPRVGRRLEDLVGIWKTEMYLANAQLGLIKDGLSSTTTTPKPAKHPDTPDADKTAKDLPFIMPSTHGDTSLPFYDLPAGNLMPHIIPNKSIPMHTDSIKALQFSAGPANESLVQAMKEFLKDIENIDNSYAELESEGMQPEFDEMGQRSYQNGGSDVTGDTYYGWSRAFCEKMKHREQSGNDGTLTRGRSRSYSSSQSRSPRKRRRYTNTSSGRSNSSRSFSPSRSQGRDKRTSTYQRDYSPNHRDRSRSTSRLRSASPSRPQFRSTQPFESSDARTYPVQTFQQHTMNPVLPPNPTNQPPRPGARGNQVFPPPPPGPGGVPIPPPRPPNWQGLWPPPPPPPPPPPQTTGHPSMGAQTYPGGSLPPPRTWSHGPSFPSFPPGYHQYGNAR